MKTFSDGFVLGAIFAAILALGTFLFLEGATVGPDLEATARAGLSTCLDALYGARGQ